MKKAITLSLLLVALSLNLKAQATNTTKNVGIGTLNPHPTAILDLDVSGADFANKLGFLVPRMTVAQRDDIQNPATGLLVFVTDGVSGFYYYTGTEWKSMNSSGVDFGDKVENAIMYYGAGNVIQSNAKLMYNATDNAVSLTGTSINLKVATDGIVKDIKFFAGNGVNSASVKVAADLENDVTFELPKNNPAEGQVLTRTAEGTMWATAGVPIGSVIPFAGSQAPEGWLIANGQEVSRTEYAALYAIIGDAYGAGDGATTFKLPNLSGAFPRGLDADATSAVGQTGGAVEAKLVAENIPAHEHTLIARHGGQSQTSGYSYLDAKNNLGAEFAGQEPPLFSNKDLNMQGLFGHLNNLNMDDAEKMPFHSTTIEGPAVLENGPTPVNTLPPYVKVLYIIRAK